MVLNEQKNKSYLLHLSKEDMTLAKISAARQGINLKEFFLSAIRKACMENKGESKTIMNDDDCISLYDLKCRIIHKIELHLDENLRTVEEPLGGLFMSYIEEYKSIVKDYPVVTLVRVGPNEGGYDTTDEDKIRIIKRAERWYRQEIHGSEE